MSEQPDTSGEKSSSSSILTSKQNPALRRILDNIEALGMSSHLLELTNPKGHTLSSDYNAPDISYTHPGLFLVSQQIQPITVIDHPKGQHATVALI